MRFTNYFEQSREEVSRRGAEGAEKNWQAAKSITFTLPSLNHFRIVSCSSPHCKRSNRAHRARLSGIGGSKVSRANAKTRIAANALAIDILQFAFCILHFPTLRFLGCLLFKIWLRPTAAPCSLRLCVRILLTAGAIISSGSASVWATESFAIIPPSSVLSGSHAKQRLIVENVSEGRFAGDKTGDAKFTSSNPAVATVDDGGVVHPVSDGEATITAMVGDDKASATVTVGGMGQDAVRSFRNDVQPVLAKMGCSMGACHGALAG